MAVGLTRSSGSAAETVARLGSTYHRTHYAADPIAATVDGVPGYDDSMPDPSRDADDRRMQELADLTTELAEVDDQELGGEDWLSHQTLARLLRYELNARRYALSEVAISASVAGVFPAIVSSIPLASVGTVPAAQAYLARLGEVGEFFDRLGARHLQAVAAGRMPTELGVRQALAQLDAYLSAPPAADPLLAPTPGAGVDADRWHDQASELVTTSIRPALARYRHTLATHLLPVGRSDSAVGVCHIPDGPNGYLAAVRAHTTTELTPDEIHRVGLGLVARLRDEFAERGQRALGTSDVTE
ncbi:MAG TPA: DUF885 family protein, partial [Micromonosporaceae bacterium]